MDEAKTTGTISRRLLVLIITLIVIVAAWSSGWYWLQGEIARRMDAQIAALAPRGIVVTCPDRRIGGFPFRIDIDCSDPTFSQVGRLISGTVKHLRVTALVYQPSLIIVELDGPLAATGPNGESVNATWTQLQSSIGFALSPVIRPQRIAVTVDDLAGGMAKPGGQEMKLVASHVELHGRPSPDAGPANDVDVAIGLTAATVSVADRIVGPEATDYGIEAAIRGLPLPIAPGDAYLKDWAEFGGKVDLRVVRLSVGDFSVVGQGSLAADGDGLVNGQIKLIASGFASLMAPSAKARGELLGIATAFTLFGKSVTEGTRQGRSLDLTIDKGRIKMGPSAFGHIPPLF